MWVPLNLGLFRTNRCLGRFSWILFVFLEFGFVNAWNIAFCGSFEIRASSFPSFLTELKLSFYHFMIWRLPLLFSSLNLPDVISSSLLRFVVLLLIRESLLITLNPVMMLTPLFPSPDIYRYERLVRMIDPQNHRQFIRDGFLRCCSRALHLRRSPTR